MEALKLNKQEIDSGEIEAYLSTKASVELVNQRLKQLKDKLEAIENSIISQIGSGHISLSHNISIKESERRVVAWKKVFVQINGEKLTKEITENTNPSIIKKLIVQRIAE